MSQATTWSVPLSGPASPDAFAARIDDSLDALLSSNSGAARPSYAVAGTIWVSDAVADTLSVYLYDGATDRLIQTVNTTTGEVTYSGGTITGDVDFGGNEAQNVSITGDVGGELLRGKLQGMTLSNNATDATNDIDIAAGSAASDGTTPVLMTLASALTKRLDAAWAVGSGNGGRMSAAAIADGTYHVWVIGRSDTGVVDVGFDVSATAPTMPANYDRKRRIGSIRRESGAIVAFFQDGDIFRRTAFSVVAGTSPFASTLLSFGVPTGIPVQPIFNVNASVAASSSCFVNIGSANGGSAQTPVLNAGAGTGAMNLYTLPAAVFTTNTSAQLYASMASSGTVISFGISGYGWIDTRGRYA